MKRITLVKAIAVLYMASGLWNVGISLWPLFDPSLPNTLDLTPLIAGVLFFRAGDNLFRLQEFGRKFVNFLLFLRAAHIVVMLAWFLFPGQSDFSTTLTLLDRLVFQLGNSYLLIAIFVAWLVIALLTIGFFMHNETKKLFVTSKTRDVSPESTQ